MSFTYRAYAVRASALLCVASAAFGVGATGNAPNWRVVTVAAVRLPLATCEAFGENSCTAPWLDTICWASWPATKLTKYTETIRVGKPPGKPAAGGNVTS